MRRLKNITKGIQIVHSGGVREVFQPNEIKDVGDGIKPIPNILIELTEGESKPVKVERRSF